jgi:hypothetical protein
MAINQQLALEDEQHAGLVLWRIAERGQSCLDPGEARVDVFPTAATYSTGANWADAAALFRSVYERDSVALTAWRNVRAMSRYPRSLGCT